MPKILIYLAAWKRPEITEICFMGIDRLRRSGLLPIEAFCVISEDSMKPLCKKYAIDYVMYKNEPLGEKKNYGLSVAMKKDFDYMVEIGSDDLLKTEFLELYPWDGPIFGLRDFVMLNSETGACRRHSEKTAAYGLGRAISREALEKVKLWPDKAMKGLDNSSTWNLARGGFLERRIRTDEPIAIDIKGPDNIWPYNHFQGGEYPLEKTLKGLSDEEINAIECLITKNKSVALIEG